MRRLLAALLAVAALGCGTRPKPDVRPAPGPEPARADRPDAVAALEKSGAGLERDASAPGRPVVGVALRNAPLDQAVGKNLAGLPRLRKLELSSGAPTEAGLAALAKLDSLEELNLQGGPSGDAVLAAVGKLTRLRHLNLNGSAVTDTGLKHLGALTYLRALGLQGTAVTGTGLKQLAGLSELRELNLKWTRVGDDDLPALAAFPELRELRLAKTVRSAPPITDRGLAVLSKLGKLERLDLSGNPRVTQAGMAAVGSLTNLVTLDLSDTGVDERGLERLAGLKKLSTLDLAGTRVLGAALARLPALEDVNLDRSPVGDAALLALKGQRRLRALRLAFTNVGDRGVEALAELPALETLDLWGAKRLTEDCLDALGKMKQLKLLKITPDRERLTEERLDELRRALPRTQIQT